MENATKLMLTIAVLIVLVGIGLYYTTYEEKATSQPPIQIRRQQPILPSERILVQFLGQPVFADKSRLAKASELFLKITQSSPEKYGVIDADLAEDNIKQIMQMTAIAIANYTTVDHACKSIVDTKTSCEKIDKNYKESRLGFSFHSEIFPIDEIPKCATYRSLSKTLEDATSGNCDAIENSQVKTACLGQRSGCSATEGASKAICTALLTGDSTKCIDYGGFYPCDLLVAIYAAQKKATPCTQNVHGMQAYLCMGIASGDCMLTYKSMIEDYTYAKLGAETGEKEFCNLVMEPTIQQGCLAGDMETVRRDFEKGYY